MPIRLCGVVGVGEPAGDVGQKDHLVSAERARDGAGGLVGVDVVGAALAVGADGGDHGNVVACNVMEDIDTDAVDLPDETDVFAPGALRRETLKREPSSPQSPTAGWPCRLSVNDVLVDLANEDHLGDLDGGRVGDP